MAGAVNTNTAGRRRPNGLQRRAPASLQISPVTEWNVAIPLLSPLVRSPISGNQTVGIKSCSITNEESAKTVAEKPAVVIKKWQHPAAPFCYEPAPFRPCFCTGSLDR